MTQTFVLCDLHRMSVARYRKSSKPCNRIGLKCLSVCNSLFYLICLMVGGALYNITRYERVLCEGLVRVLNRLNLH